ncbi:MAG TPA: AbrB/MazE/SpoVT family DNA-binding domain-containing protein [Chloroflexi bacterium]|nr:AbrB/MazE/SpoVT family DNA-binding domain-containing protein [Chloroflexota bacterium]
MPTVVKTRIIQIGNSQGVRIPKLLLEQVHWDEDEEVMLELQSDQIVLRPTHEARQGWEAAFKTMSERGDDEMLDGDVVSTTSWDEEAWTW